MRGDRRSEHASGVLMIESNDGGKRTRASLGLRDRRRAKREADDAAAKLAIAETLPEEPRQEVTLGRAPRSAAAAPALGAWARGGPARHVRSRPRRAEDIRFVPVDKMGGRVPSPNA